MRYFDDSTGKGFCPLGTFPVGIFSGSLRMPAVFASDLFVVEFFWCESENGCAHYSAIFIRPLLAG
jgi:hypothetical protein